MGRDDPSRRSSPQITQMEMGADDLEVAEKVAAKLGYKQTAYTSTSDMWGLYCLSEHPEHSGPHHGGCVVKTEEFGIIFVQNLEDLGLSKLAK